MTSRLRLNILRDSLEALRGAERAADHELSRLPAGSRSRDGLEGRRADLARRRKALERELAEARAQ